ncbi:hypothetical protein [Streptomyces pseudovenezuelae]|uniref:Cytochrome P450 n=1 Tax=Streptomyces pseudovenezuelae TaxID=67350 RepID=A0ABZ1X8T5_9ACTN|nr:hypothetical protein [Streptomyces pseudovenezuelae]
MTEVHVARGRDGSIRVAADAVPGQTGGDDESAPGADFTRSVLDVAGALLVWPVLGARTPPVAYVHDVRRAQQWLWAVYGDGVAAAVHDAAAGELTGVRVRARTGALAGTAARLGLGHWAARWWPASYTDGIAELEGDVLGLELAALTHQCQELFDYLDDSVAELIEEHRAALDPLLRWWHATPRPAQTARHLGSVLRLIDDAADCAGLDGPELRRLRSALDEERGHGRTPAPVDLSALFPGRDGHALAAGAAPGAGGRVIARGSGTNDWRRYPPGFVDAAEDAVSWTARAHGALRQIEVEVVAHVTAPAAGVPLAAEVRVNGGTPHRVPLTRRDDVWAGRGELDLPPGAGLPVTAPPRIEVGVLLPGFDPGHGPDTGVEREAIRDLARRRLADAAQPGAYGTEPFLAEILAAATGEDY